MTHVDVDRIVVDLLELSADLATQAHAHARQQCYSIAHETWCKKRGVDIAIQAIRGLCQE